MYNNVETDLSFTFSTFHSITLTLPFTRLLSSPRQGESKRQKKNLIFSSRKLASEWPSEKRVRIRVSHNVVVAAAVELGIVIGAGC